MSAPTPRRRHLLTVRAPSPPLPPCRAAHSQAATERHSLADQLARASLIAERAAAAVGGAAAAAAAARDALESSAAELRGALAPLSDASSPLAAQWDALRALPAEPPAAEAASPGFDVAQWQLKQALDTAAEDGRTLTPQLEAERAKVRRALSSLCLCLVFAAAKPRACQTSPARRARARSNRGPNPLPCPRAPALQTEERCRALAEAEARCAALTQDVGVAKRAAFAEGQAAEGWAAAAKRLSSLRAQAERAVKLRAEEEAAHSLSSQNAFFTAGR